MPKCTIIYVLTATDRPRYECNKLVMFENQPLLATGDQPDRTKECAGTIQCAEETCRRAWLAEDGHVSGRSKGGKWGRVGFKYQLLAFFLKIAKYLG